MNYVQKGWFSKKEDEYRVKGFVTKSHPNGKKEYLFKIHGYWNGKIYITKFMQKSFENEDKFLLDNTK